MVYLFPRASIIKFHKLSDLNTEIYFLTVLEAGSLSSSVSRATLPLKALGKGLFQASLFSGVSLACGNITPIFTWHSPGRASVLRFSLL